MTYAIWIEDSTAAWRMFDAVSTGGSRGRENNTLRCMNQLEIGISNKHLIAEKIQEWRAIAKSAINMDSR